MKQLIYGLRKKKKSKIHPQKIGSFHLNPQVKNTRLLCSQVSLEHKACTNSTLNKGKNGRRIRSQ
jgi:hypothetical protein